MSDLKNRLDSQSLTHPFLKFTSMFRRDQRWRIQLFVLRKLIDGGLDNLKFTQAQATTLFEDVYSTPEAWLPAYRQLRRLDRGEEILERADEAWSDGDTEDSGVALACARLWYDSGQVASGDEALATAMRIEPDNKDLYVEQAFNRRWRGNKALAIEGAERVMSLDPSPDSSSEWSLFIGVEQAKSGNYALALPYFLASESAPHEWRDWYHAGVTFQAMEMPHDAEKAYERAARAYRKDHARFWTPQRLHLIMGRHQAIIDELSVVSGDSPSAEAERKILIAKAYLYLERPNEASAVLEGLPLGRANFESAIITALALELSADYARALELYKGMLEYAPRRSRDIVRFRLARAAYFAGEHEVASEHWAIGSKRFSLNRFEPEVDPKFAGRMAQAQRLLRNKEWKEALVLLDRQARAVSDISNLNRVAELAGRAHYSLGSTQSAAQVFSTRADSMLADPSELAKKTSPLTNTELYAQFLQVLELDTEVVLYESFHGSKTSCNPLALCLWLLENKPELKHVWAISPESDINPQLMNDERVTFVMIHSAGYMRHLATAGYLVNNTTFPRYFVRRDGQKYLNTWHGIPWKHMGGDSSESPFGFENVSRNLLQATHLAFPNAHTAEVMLRSQDVQSTCTARVGLTGQARVDRTVGASPEETMLLRERLGVPAGNNTVLYAPTWRGDDATVEQTVFNFVEAINEIAKLPQVTVFLRVHHFVSSALSESSVPQHVVIVPDEVDTNELLAATDLLVSDYSSIIFDFAPLDRPIVKYLYDAESYMSERGLYFSPEEIPGANVYSADQLRPSISQALHSEEPVQHVGEDSGIWPREDGKSSERTAKFFFENDATTEYPVTVDESRVLISMVSMNPNGITRSLQNLLSTNKRLAGHAHILVPQGATQNVNDDSRILELHTLADFTLTTQRVASTRRENMAWRRLRGGQPHLSMKLHSLLASRAKREVKRLFGDFKFVSVVDFDGYGLPQALLLALGFDEQTRRTFVFHNEFAEEAEGRFPGLWSIAPLLRHFSALPSVSEAAMAANRDALENRFGIPPHLHSVMENTINPQSIREQARSALPEDLASWYGRPGKHICVVGRLSVEKNQSAAIEALSLIVKDGGEVPFLSLIGDGPQRSELERLVTERGVEEFVFFAGQRANPYPAIAKADALIVTSLHEGQSLVLLEALTIGTPVASTDVSGPRSVLEHGKFGLLVPPTVEGVRQMIEALTNSEYPVVERFDAESYLLSAERSFNRTVLADE